MSKFPQVPRRSLTIDKACSSVRASGSVVSTTALLILLAMLVHLSIWICHRIGAAISWNHFTADRIFNHYSLDAAGFHNLTFETITVLAEIVEHPIPLILVCRSDDFHSHIYPRFL